VSDDESLVGELSGMVDRGDLSDTAYLAVVHERELRADEEVSGGVGLTYGEAVVALLAVIALLLATGLAVALL
jgi:hypothetical protein